MRWYEEGKEIWRKSFKFNDKLIIEAFTGRVLRTYCRKRWGEDSMGDGRTWNACVSLGSESIVR